MAVYNGERFLLQQVESVLKELLPEDELIVVDDGSTDRSVVLLDSINSSAIRILKNDFNLGVIGTFERGLRYVIGEIVFLCDQDDVWLPGKRATIVAAFENDPELSIVVSDAEIIDGEGRVTSPSFMTTRGGFAGGFFSTLWRNRYLGCAMAMRRSVLANAIPVPRNVPMHDMWFGLVGKLTGKVLYLPRPLIQYRRHGGNVSPSRRQSMIQMLCWRINLLVAVTIRLTGCLIGLHKDRFEQSE
jgi:hypothetical protein